MATEIPNFLDKEITRFWGHVGITAIEDRCWEWQSTYTKDGYGRFKISRKEYRKHFRAPRIAFFLDTGVDPSENQICHTCDNPKCCNPKHLFLGNPKINRRDCVDKNRHNVPIGMQCPWSKFSKEEVLFIRDNYPGKMSLKKLSEQFKVAKGTIYAIAMGQRYKDIN